MEEIDLTFKDSNGQVKVLWKPNCISEYKKGRISWEELKEEIQKIIDSGEAHGYYPRRFRKYRFAKIEL
jgi:hypothetical protein